MRTAIQLLLVTGTLKLSFCTDPSATISFLPTTIPFITTSTGTFRWFRYANVPGSNMVSRS